MNDINSLANESRSVYENHRKSNDQGYYSVMEQIKNELQPRLTNGMSPFTKEGFGNIVFNDGLYKKYKDRVVGLFAGDSDKQALMSRLMDNNRTLTQIDNGLNSMEGWGGASAVNESGQGMIPSGVQPFVIGGWLATTRSQEIYQIIDQDSQRINMIYQVDYLMNSTTGERFYAPGALRDGTIEGFNLLPEINWANLPAHISGTPPEWKPPTDTEWAGQDGKIYFAPTFTNGAAGVAGTWDYAPANKASVSGLFSKAMNIDWKHRGLEKNCSISSIIYKNHLDETKEVYTDIHYEGSTGPTNERVFKTKITLPDMHVTAGNTPVPGTVLIVGLVNLDEGSFMVSYEVDTPKTGVTAGKGLMGFSFMGYISNIGNELEVPTVGTEKIELIRECYYRNYANIGLNEYMLDQFKLGNESISYPAYATDRLLQWTIHNRELEAETHLISNINNPRTLDTYALTKKLGGFHNGDIKFDISQYTPGIDTQAYKDGLKTYLTKVLAATETETNVPTNVKKEWIFLGYDAVVSEFPNFKYADLVVNNDTNPQGGAANQSFGFAVDTRCGFMDNLGRSVRIIGNTDGRWKKRGSKMFATLRTYSMEYPFMVYYPYAIRMFTTIDANSPKRTAITVAGREFRGDFALCSVGLTINNVLDNENFPVNNFDQQIANSKDMRIANTPDSPVYMEEVTAP